MNKTLLTLIVAAVVSAPAFAKVTPDKAAALGTTLTPFGAEKAANADGSIPAWDGGLKTAPACYKGKGTRYCDPFAEDQPKFTITKANLDQYKAKLTPGQINLFAKYPDAYKIPVYPTRRAFSAPQSVYDATLKNATSADLGGNGEALTGAATGIPFPIPGNGMEVMWNHKVRYRTAGVQRWNNQFAVTVTGDYNMVKIKEDAWFVYSTPGITPDKLNNKIIYFLQNTVDPPRLAGTLLLVHETMDQIKEPRGAWQYNPGQRRLRRAPNVAYDNPGTASDGLRTNDQLDMFNGAMDRYEWKLVGKKELYVPANSYKIHSDKYKYKDLMKKSVIAQDLTRYELRRVWVVDSTLKKGTNHIYKRRTFYVDEDTWQIVEADVYDSRDQLWRVQEAHSFQAYDIQATLPAIEVVYDLQSARYLVMAANNEDTETVEKSFDEEFFNPANVAKQASK